MIYMIYRLLTIIPTILLDYSSTIPQVDSHHSKADKEMTS